MLATKGAHSAQAAPYNCHSRAEPTANAKMADGSHIKQIGTRHDGGLADHLLGDLLLVLDVALQLCCCL